MQAAVIAFFACSHPHIDHAEDPAGKMRLLINCPSGESRLLQVDAQATVLELKQVLQEAEGPLEAREHAAADCVDYAFLLSMRRSS